MKNNLLQNATIPATEQAKVQRDREAFLTRLKHLSLQVENPEDGFFGPDSISWKLYREPGIIFGSMRALLLQISHPAVADGVYHFSNFKKDTFGRAKRTFTSMYNLFYGDVKSALRSARALNNMHYLIRGTYNDIHGFNKTYCANDVPYLLWVWATIVDTTIKIYAKTYRPLTEDELNKYYDEMKTAATLLGIPPNDCPQNLQAFNTYFEDTLYNGTLHVDAQGLDICHALIHSPYNNQHLARIMSVGALPPHISRAFGLTYSDRKVRQFNRLTSFAKWFFKITPSWITYAPPYHQAHHRASKARGEQSPFFRRVFCYLAKKGWVPFSI